MLNVDALNFEKGGGLLTVVTRDARSGAVLMVAHADREAVEKTLSTGEMHYRSRSRGLWHKGATSGNVQKVVALTPDCDGDALLADVIPAGPSCHELTESCFKVSGTSGDAFSRLEATLLSRVADPKAAAAAKSYTHRLLSDRNLRLKKLGEEMAELVTACADGDANRATEEAVDVVYHLLVALRGLGVGLSDVRRVLDERAKK